MELFLIKRHASCWRKSEAIKEEEFRPGKREQHVVFEEFNKPGLLADIDDRIDGRWKAVAWFLLDWNAISDETFLGSEKE